ncbi:cation:proton antiporter [Candidatus Synechococcus calcipolaris G9]|uniref:Cation:proton antiporter n=1 Tax=Candidatus Synechococcus calcipolaris G9 TaxID=1497997 RepID=A0ABT6EXX9_9SYNE|nr:cation:proton antiporter [Candidatus Synechococcus calcipolaris]MDG2990096.1 cation:proton antiporter [Candidatus Synechococcus calcipolaris G9]
MIPALSLENVTIAWVILPFFVGLTIYLFPKIDRPAALLVATLSGFYGLGRLVSPTPLTLELLDNFGVSLRVDTLSGYFILTNAIVTASVILYSWPQGKTVFFYTQVMMLHGSANAAFICNDLLSLYVNLEVLSLVVFLLVAYPRSDRSIWVALRYLFISNTAMLFYLMGTILVYQANNSFRFEGLGAASPEAIALILLALFTKGGIFLSGLWLPLTNSESEAAVSALMAGVVENVGIFSLLRAAQNLEQISVVVGIFGVATAFLGLSFAIFEQNIKRLLALSTISQLGWILVAPAVGGIYALAHGLAKSSLFLTVGNVPQPTLPHLKQQPMARSIYLPLAIAALSIAGCPLLAGFGAKMLTLDRVLLWQEIALNIAAVGTAIVYSKLIFLPSNNQTPPGEGSLLSGYGPAIGLLLLSLLAANGLSLAAYTPENLLKAFVILGFGGILYGVGIRRLRVRLPRLLEQFDHLIGAMSLILMLLFWMTFVLDDVGLG